jgi:hypothetical protein
LSIRNEYVSFSGWKQLAYQGKYINTNTDGERNTPENLSDSTKQVVRFFGGSTMWGVGATDSNTIPALFHRDKPNFQVFNHGIQAFNSRQSFERLVTLYQLDNKADFVIFYDGVNEISMCAKTIDIPGHYESDVFKQKLPEIKRNLATSSIIRNGLNDIFIKNLRAMIGRIKNKLFPVAVKVDDCNNGYVCDCDSVRTQKIASLLVKNWELSKTIVESKGGKFIAILQPVSAIGNPDVSYLGLDKTNEGRRLQLNYEKLYAAIKEELKQKKYTWVYDLSDILDHKKPYYLDWCHVNAEANILIAKRIGEIVALEHNKTRK